MASSETAKVDDAMVQNEMEAMDDGDGLLARENDADADVAREVETGDVSCVMTMPELTLAVPGVLSVA